MKRNGQQGFTLIELIMVIVILGILAATALPKFVDLSEDAHKATADAVLGAANSAAAMNYAKSLLDSTNIKILNTNVGAGTLLGLLDVSSDWKQHGTDASIYAVLGAKTYTISIDTAETASGKAVLSLASS